MIRFQQVTGLWRLTCDLCELREDYAKFWRANYSRIGHEAMHAAEG